MLSVNQIIPAKEKNFSFRDRMNRDNAVRTTGFILLAAVLLLILIDIILRKIYSVSPDNIPYVYKLMSIGRDGSFAETYTHGMSFSAALLFFATAVSVQSRLCFGLAAFMAIAWFDDSAHYHERFGFEFAKIFPDIEIFSIGASHIGELLAWISIGIVLLSLALWSSRRMMNGDWTVLRLVVFPVSLLIACASVVDLLHSALPGTVFDTVLMYLEDGGEMIAILMLTLISLYLVRNAHSIYGEHRLY